MKAVEGLLEARLSLEKAAVEFLGACTALKTTALSPLVSFPSQIAFENVVQSVLSSIDSVELVEDYVDESRAVLNGLLNMSPSRVPINTLPPEILGRIFSFVVATSTCYYRYDEDTSMKLPLVCTKWHQVATSTPSLWTHIDISFTHFLPATALGRARKLLDRYRNIPVHIHFDDGNQVKPADVPDIVATLQPHVEFLSSLYITNTRFHALIDDLLRLVSRPGAANSLKYLSLNCIDGLNDQEGRRSWPVYTLQGLTQLELIDLRDRACPSMKDTARLLSSCPALHTLRLIHLDTVPEQSRDRPTVRLPNLRFLEIMRVDCREALLLLSSIAPGVLALDVRLDAIYTVERDGSTLPGQVFLARANFVSLSMNFYHHYHSTTPLPDQHFESLFTCVPHLRLLCLNGYYIHSEVARILGTRTTDAASPALPILQSLCVGRCRLCPGAASQLKQIIETRGLSNLIFLDCTYPPSFLGANYRQTHMPGSATTLDFSQYVLEMPESMKEWFLEDVGKVMTEPELRGAKVYHGRDQFVQGLIAID